MDSDGYAWTLGTLLIGVFFNTFLFGINSYQFGVYFYGKFNDPVWLRVFVGGLCAVDTFHSALSLYIAWFYCIENYTSPEMLTHPLWAYCLTPIAEAVPAIITHSFLASRVLKATKSKIIFGVIMLFALLTFAFGMATGIEALSLQSLTEASRLYNLCVPWLTFQAVTNVALTGSLSWVLFKSRSGNKQIECNLLRTAPRVLEIGFPATMFASLSLVTYLLFGSSSSNLYAAFALPLGRIYTLIILDVLNMRRRSKEDEDIEIPGRIKEAEIAARKRASVGIPSGVTNTPVVRVTTPSLYSEEEESEFRRTAKRNSTSSLGSGAPSSQPPCESSPV